MRMHLLSFFSKRLRKKNFGGVLVEIYSKPDCHLCDDAKANLRKMQRQHGFQLREVNIANDKALLAEYGARIPLVLVNGQLACKYFVDEKMVVRKMTLAIGRMI